MRIRCIHCYIHRNQADRMKDILRTQTSFLVLQEYLANKKGGRKISEQCQPSSRTDFKKDGRESDESFPKTDSGHSENCAPKIITVTAQASPVVVGKRGTSLRL